MSLFKKGFVIMSLANSYPAYLEPGKVALFDNFEVSKGVFMHFSTTVSHALRLPSEATAETWIDGILHLHPRFAPLTIIPVYDPYNSLT